MNRGIKGFALEWYSIYNAQTINRINCTHDTLIRLLYLVSTILNSGLPHVSIFGPWHFGNNKTTKNIWTHHVQHQRDSENTSLFSKIWKEFTSTFLFYFAAILPLSPELHCSRHFKLSLFLSYNQTALTTADTLFIVITKVSQ